MKHLILGLVLVAGIAVMAYAQTALFSLKPVQEPSDGVACAKAGGRAALVADLSEEGQLASSWEPFCLMPAKGQ